MVPMIKMRRRYFFDLTMFLVVSFHVLFMATNRLDVEMVLILVVSSLEAFVIGIFGVLAFGKFS